MTAGSPDRSLTSPIRSRLAELFEGMESDAPALTDQLVGSFLVRVPRYLHELTAAAQRGDSSTVETAAHGLKGAAGNLGATQIAALAAELELIGQETDLTHAGRVIAELEREFADLRSELAESPLR